MDRVDIHTHILYGVDDGSPSEEVSLEMLDQAYADGTRSIFFTPHGTGKLDLQKVKESLAVLNAKVKERWPDLTTYLGCEVYYTDEIIEGLNAGRLPTLADSRYVLIEYGTRVFYGDLLDSIRLFTMNGYLPIIAHADRYDCMTPMLAYQLVDTGAYIQLNASTVIGSSGFKAKRLCAKLLKDRLVHFIASDAHDPQRRRPVLSAAYSRVSRKYGEDYADKLFCENGKCVAEHKVIGGN